MRLQQPIYAHGRVQSIRLRVVASDVPNSAEVRITDVQLQAGEQATGVVPNPAEVGTTPARAQYRNGVIAPGLRVVALSNADKATPTLMQLRNARGQVAISSYRFGDVASADVDGRTGQTTTGHGRPPIITERQDLHLHTTLEHRAHLRMAWEERE